MARIETIRLILALAAQQQWEVYQFDVKLAFLNGDLKEEVFVQQPEGFIVPGQEGKIYRLKKALYGLKQAPRAWYSKIDNFFRFNGFQKSPSEPTMYFRKQGDAGIMLVSLYVDDMIYTGSSKELIYQFKMEMMKTFEMTDLGKLHYFLGIEIKQTNTGIFIAQEKYVSDMLKGLNMENIEPVTTPMNTNEKLTCEDGT